MCSQNDSKRKNFADVGRLPGLPCVSCSSDFPQLPENRSRLIFIRKTFALSGTLPATLCDLVKLETLTLASNLLSALPENFANLKALKKLDLSENCMTKFPAELCSLPLLDVLDVSKNKISEIPKNIKNINTSELNMNQNQVRSRRV